MRMDDPIPTFTYLVSKVVETHPDLAFIHLVEPGVGGGTDIEAKAGEVSLPMLVLLCKPGLSHATRVDSQTTSFASYGFRAP